MLLRGFTTHKLLVSKYVVNSKTLRLLTILRRLSLDARGSCCDKSRQSITFFLYVLLVCSVQFFEDSLISLLMLSHNKRTTRHQNGKKYVPNQDWIEPVTCSFVASPLISSWCHVQEVNKLLHTC